MQIPFLRQIAPHGRTHHSRCDGAVFHCIRLHPFQSGDAMNWDRIEGNWKQLKGKVREQWGRLTDDELDKIAGRREKLAGCLQNSYGIARDEAEKQIKDFEAAKEKCKSLTGNAKDVCMKEAKGNERVAKAELEAKRKGTPHAQYEVDVAKAKAAYEVAQEKCDDMKGAEKSACKKQAKADE